MKRTVCNARRSLLVPALTPGFALTLLLGSGSAHALTPVDPAGGCPQTLSAPGQYVLTGDLTCTGPVNGIVVTSSNVTFQLAGHVISNSTCDLDSDVVGIFVRGGISRVRIEGGKVSGFNDGIILSSSRSHVVGMTVVDACAFGILGQAQNNVIEKNVVTGSGDGVALVPARFTRVSSNDLSGNVRAGVAISDFADSNIIDNNILNENGNAGEGYGVAIFNGTNNLVWKNVANGNDFGISIQSAVNRDGSPGSGNAVLGNSVSGNAKLGIWVSQAGATSSVRRNTVLGSGDFDMLDESPGCGGNAWVNNTFETDQVDGVSDGGPGVGCVR